MLWSGFPRRVSTLFGVGGVALTLAALCFIVRTTVAAGPAKPGAGVAVQIDVQADQGPMRRAGAGFLHAFKKDDPPIAQADELYKPLKVRFYRSGITNLDEFHRRAPDAMLVGTFSDAWGYPIRSASPPPPPYLNWPKWDALVTKYVTAYKPFSKQVIYDVYNEPNLKDWFGSWAKNEYVPGWEGATFEKFCELYLRTYKLIRKIDPNAKITAPGVTYPDRDGMEYVRKFKDFCVKNHCVPNYWNWHFGGDDIPKHVAEVLAWKLNEGVLIPEYIGPEQSLRTGRVAYEITLMEDSGATGAMKANWRRYGQQPGNFNGLLVEKPSGPWGKRGPWYVFRTLAEMDGQRVRAASSASQISALASYQADPKSLVVLLGNSFAGMGKGGTGASGSQNAGYQGPVRVSIGGLKDFGPAVHIKLECIPANDNKEVVKLPPPVVDENAKVKDGAVQMAFDWKLRDDAYRLYVTPAAKSR